MIHAFLSFVEEDLNVVNLFRAQAKNANSDLEFADYSLKEPFDSINANYIARGIVQRLNHASLTVCLYGQTTYTSRWVDWELRKTLELQKPIMGVRLYGSSHVLHYPAPAALEGHPIVQWNVADIVRTMRRLVQ